jgi:outer membrane protein OmpA-like peptidoglycan-associated protein
VELAADDEDPFKGDPSASKETFIGRGVLFAFNSDEASEDLIKILTPMVEYLKRPPGFKQLIIEGHTDSVGGAPYNLELSKRRAAKVKKSLVSLGLPAAKIKSSGFGEEKPIAPNTNYQGRSRNRRVEFKVYR